MSQCKPGSTLQTLKFESTPVRMEVGANGEPWFNANDVCTALGYANPWDALSKHVDAEDLAKREAPTGKGGRQMANYINESGVYALIFGSHRPEAKKFKRWVTKDVLPSIRKTGAYVVPMPAVREAVAKLFVHSTIGAWVKRFPDEFYWHIYRMRGWTWRNMEANHPQAVAGYTNDYIWERLGPGVLEELEKRNPADAKGNRKARHHQYLTDVGHPVLSGHMHAVLSIMRASRTWDDFALAMDRFHPRQGRNLLLALVDDLMAPPRFTP